MKVGELKNALSKMPDSYDITVRDFNSNIWSNIERVTVKQSADRVFINYTYSK